jgi:hypothetical protein
MADVTAGGNEGSGIYFKLSSNASIGDVDASRNGGSGISVSEGGFISMRSVTANDNGGNGVSISEPDAGSLVDVTANGNGRRGLYVGEMFNLTAERVTISENGGYGIRLGEDGYYNEFSGVYVSDNAEGGLLITGHSSANVFRDSTIERNGGVGIKHEQNDRNEFRNVTVRDNDGRQIEGVIRPNDPFPFSASELRIGDSAEFAFDEEMVSLDDLERDELPALPEGVQPVGDGVSIEAAIDDGLDTTLEYDDSGDEARVELWRYDGSKWAPVEEGVTAADGRLDSTLFEGGTYAPVRVDVR